MTPFFPASNLTSFRHGNLRSSSPQRPLEDMQIIYAIFAGSVIKEGAGKCATQVSAAQLLLLALLRGSHVSHYPFPRRTPTGRYWAGVHKLDCR